MPVRLTARWQTKLDERILERLRDAGETKPDLLACELAVGEGLVQDRLRLLAQVELVDVERKESTWYELSYWGQLYLDGEYDVELHPRPNRRTGHRSVV